MGRDVTERGGLQVYFGTETQDFRRVASRFWKFPRGLESTPVKNLKIFHIPPHFDATVWVRIAE